MGYRVVFETELAGYPIRLIQTAKSRFTVEYGEQRKEALDYSGAATELGVSIMHASACMGRLDQ